MIQFKITYNFTANDKPAVGTFILKAQSVHDALKEMEAPLALLNAKVTSVIAI